MTEYEARQFIELPYANMPVQHVAYPSGQK